jgi:TRAP-type transport system periplasmic protein
MASKQTKDGAKTEGRSSGRLFTRRNMLEGGLALGAGLTIGGFGIIGKAAAAPVTMRFGSDSPIGAPHTKSAVVMKELVESRTSGRVQVTIFPDGQLGGTGAMTNSIKSGTLDAVVTAVSLIAPAVPEIDVFDLPFLYKNNEEVLRAATGPLGARLTPKVNEAFACENLGYTTGGATELWTTKRPIRTPDDVAGLKIGVSSSRIQRDTILALGGIPTVMDITAAYTGLKTGLIDGTNKSRPDGIELKLYQVVKYMTLSNLYTMPNLLLVSKKFMDKLSPEDQAIVREAAKPALDAQTEAVIRSEEASLDFLREKGIELVQLENRAAFRDKVEVVYKDAADRIGADLIAEARKLATI